MPTLMPLMYALARCGHLPRKMRAKNQLGDKAGANGQQGARVTLEDAVGQLPDQQDAGDEQRGKIAVAGAEESLQRLKFHRLRGLGVELWLTHSASFTL